MANEIKFGWVTGATLTYSAFIADGSPRGSGDVPLPENGVTGYYTATPVTTLGEGDIIIVEDSTGVIGAGEFQPEVTVSSFDAGSKEGYKLASDGLDLISITEPTGKATNFREMIIQLWRRFFGKSTLSTSFLITYKEDGTTVATTQQVSETSTLQTQGESS